MVITIDTDRASVTVVQAGRTAEHPLYSPEAFHLLSREWLKLGWNLGHWQTFSWLGRQFLQLPDDMLRLAEAVWRLRPSVIVETGVYDGGGTLWLATLCRMMDHGRVVAIDCEPRPGLREAFAEYGAGRITFLEADSADPRTAASVAALVQPGESVFVFLDSDHTRRHVAAELAHLAPLVTAGSYLVVADSNLPDLADLPNGEPAWTTDHPGAAVDEFLRTHPEFFRDPPQPLFGAAPGMRQLSYFSNTWLRRVDAPVSGEAAPPSDRIK